MLFARKERVSLKNNQLKKKAGQLLIIGFDGKTVPQSVKELIEKYHIGGIILFSRNIGTPQETLALTTELQKIAKEVGYEQPLLICIDQENGVVRRLEEGYSIFPGAMTLGATGNPDNAYEIGMATGRELKALGINWNLAPVLDMNNNPDNPVIGVRSFGESPEQVAQFGKATMQGMQTAGIATALKHFPGHGDTKTDSHLDLPVITHSRKRLDQIELKPFKECIESGADTVMAAHVYFPTIEDEPDVPATLSRKVITDLLREELGFNGVVTTDCMEMNAISETIGTEKGAVKALTAGVDLIMVSHRMDRQIGAIEEISRAIESGEINEKIIDKSIRRIKALRSKYLSWDDLSLNLTSHSLNIVGNKTFEEMAYEVYKQGVTIVRNDGVLPMSIDKEVRTLVINPENSKILGVEDRKQSRSSLGDAVKEYNPYADVYQIPRTMNESEIETVYKMASQYDLVIIGTLSIDAKSYEVNLIEKLLDSKIKIIIVGMRNPYDLIYLSNITTYINTYEFSYPALKVAAGAIYGREEVTGKSPVTLRKH